MFVAMRGRKGADVSHDPAVSILFGIALLLILLNLIASALVAASGLAYAGLLKATLLLTAAFAIAGMAFGFMRGLHSKSA